MDQSPKQLSFQWGGSLLEMIEQAEFILIDDQFHIAKCNFQCLTNCPLPPGMYEPNCIYDDPLIGMFDLFQYPEHTFWRWDHEDLVRPEPADPFRTRCPRCFSTAIVIGYPYIECKNCNYNEPLIDFPISQYFHLALLQEENERQMRSRDKSFNKPRRMSEPKKVSESASHL